MIRFARVAAILILSACPSAAPHPVLGALTLSLDHASVLPGGATVAHFQSTVAGKYFVAVGAALDSPALAVVSRGVVAANTAGQASIAASVLTAGANVVVVVVFPAAGGQTLQAVSPLTLSVPVVPTCSDGVTNGSETDQDCGGTCGGCANGRACAAAGDCLSGTCSLTHCVSAPATGCAFASSVPTGPVLFFTDLESGPNHGGENDGGVFLTLYGLRFGATRNDSTVTIGGHEVARYVTWNDAADLGTGDADRLLPRGLQRITVQLGSGIPSGVNDVVVVVGNVSSNALHFTVREGKILFVDPAAAASGDGSAGAPLAHLADLHGSGVLVPGTTVYIKSGGHPITEVDPTLTSVNLNLDAAVVPSGSLAAPIALAGYPGDPPTMGNPNGTAAGRPIAVDPLLKYYTFAGLRLSHAQCINLGSTRSRLVGCRVDTMNPDFLGAVVIPNSPWVNTELYGNFFYEVGAIGIGDGQAVDVGWNEVNEGDDVSGGFSFDGPTSLDVSFHHNLMKSGNQNDLYIGGTVARVSISSNILSRGDANAPFANIFMAYSGSAAAIDIAGNTFLRTANFWMSNPEGPPGTITLRDNIFSPDSSQTYVVTTDEPSHDLLSFGTVSHNLYDDAVSTAPPFPSEPGALHTNPLFTSRLTDDVSFISESPARDGGIDTGYCSDYFGVQRPQGAAYDIGAVEFVP